MVLKYSQTWLMQNVAFLWGNMFHSFSDITLKFFIFDHKLTVLLVNHASFVSLWYNTLTPKCTIVPFLVLFTI